MTKKRTDWIIVDQNPDTLKKYIGSVVMVARCLRCEEEDPIFEGPLRTAMRQLSSFGADHRRCKERGEAKP